MDNRSNVTGFTATGMDLGDKHSQVCVLDEAGVVIEEARIATTKAALERRFRGVEPQRIAIEAGTHSPWVSRLLKEYGHDVMVANPRKLRLIFENESKNDRVDAEYLARVARLDPKLLAPIEPRGEEAQRDRAILRARDALVRARTALVNQVRGTVKSHGARIRKCSAESFAKQAAAQIPEDLAPALTPLLEVIDDLTRRIRDFEKRIETVSERYPETRVLRRVPGVGPITALAYVLTIDDPRRFKRSRSVGSYLGLRPRKSESGQADPQLRITKAGDGFVRKLLVQAAQWTLGPFGHDTDLRRWGLALAERGGKNAKKRAVIAVARKLAVLLHRLWITGTTYVPLRPAEQS
jgi:transposase